MIKKIFKALKAFGLIAAKPALLNLIFQDNDYWRNYLVKRRKSYKPLEEVNFSALFTDFNITLAPVSFRDGGSMVTDLALLKGLAGKINNCSYFEIGTWRGESVAVVSPVCSECYTMDLPDDEKQKLGMDEEYIGQHAILSQHLKNVIHLKNNSLRFDFSSLNKKFDLVFIDGDHHYESILNDTVKAFKHLVHANTIVVWHDYAYQPGTIRNETFAAILDAVDEPLHSKLFYIANTMCAVYFPFPDFQETKANDLFKVNLQLL
jgi:predicted O-methyltransferase YrrM